MNKNPFYLFVIYHLFSGKNRLILSVLAPC